MAKRIQHYESPESPEIAVSFDPNLCIHSARCLQGLPEVFDVGRRRWIAPEAAATDAIAEVIARCPSGALTYERLDGGPAEQPETQLRVLAVPDGPLYVRGDITIADPEGNTVYQGTRAAICRCGGSANKPFCDNTHRSNGFLAP